jgi:hypothetical protein
MKRSHLPPIDLNNTKKKSVKVSLLPITMDNTWRKSALTIMSKTTTTPGNEETVEEMFSEPSLEDPLEEHFAQFEFDLDHDMIRKQAKGLLDSTPKNNKVEEEEQTKVLEESYREKEESTKTSSTSTPILEVPRAQERSRMRLCDEQIENIEIEKLPKYSSYFIPVYDSLPNGNCLRRLIVVHPNLQTIGIPLQ